MTHENGRHLSFVKYLDLFCCFFSDIGSRKEICAQTSVFLIHRIRKFQDSQLRIRINTKPNDKQKWSEECSRKMTFLLISTAWKAEVCAETINVWRILKRSVVLLRRQRPFSHETELSTFFLCNMYPFFLTIKSLVQRLDCNTHGKIAKNEVKTSHQI